MVHRQIRGPQDSGCKQRKYWLYMMARPLALHKGIGSIRLLNNVWLLASALCLFVLVTSAVLRTTGYQMSKEGLTSMYDKWEPSISINQVFARWDASVGCKKYVEEHKIAVGLGFNATTAPRSLQQPDMVACQELKRQHVSILVKKWTWIPDNLNNLYSCRCGLTCLWTNTEVLSDHPDAHFFEFIEPPSTRRQGEPLRVYMELEAHRKPAKVQDLFVSYHAKDSLQVTYAGALFHIARNYYVSPSKNDEVLVYWSSSRCLDQRQKVAKSLLSLLPHHSFGKCLNNVGGTDRISSMYPKCKDQSGAGAWSQNLHCAMSHYKFALAIENTWTESYVTEKLFYPLDVGTVPIYFGAPNVLDLVPPHSIIDGSKFPNMEKLADYVKQVAASPVLYAEYHAWRRCGIMGKYVHTRAVSLDSLPCRLCAAVSKLGGKDAPVASEGFYQN